MSYFLWGIDGIPLTKKSNVLRYYHINRLTCAHPPPQTPTARTVAAPVAPVLRTT
jgi:hypothetical protein